VRVNLRKVRHILEHAARRCDPDIVANKCSGFAAFGAAIYDPATGDTQHGMLEEALRELEKIPEDELHYYPEGSR
jgi:hypothetical protein